MKPGSRLNRLAAVAFGALLSFSALADTRADETLLLDIHEARAPLGSCVNAYFPTTNLNDLSARLFATRKFDDFLRETESVVGRDDEHLVDLRAKPTHDPADINVLLALLGAMAADESSAPMAERLLRMKAVVVAHSWIAQGSEGRCTVPPELLTLIAKIPNADH